MITPDHREEPRRRRPSGTIATAVGLAATLVGGLLLASLTSPDPEAIEAATPTSTTSTTLADVEPPIDPDNFSIEQIARGEPLEWESALRVVEGYPIELLSHDGYLYLFATEVPNFSGFERGGLRAWRSRDGIRWESLGQVIDDSHMIGSVSSTGQGMVALGSESGRPGLGIWISEDGTDWIAHEISIEGTPHLTTIYPNTAGGTDDLLVVSGFVEIDYLAPLREKLGEIAAYGWGADVIAGELLYTLYGPLGLPLAAVSGEELGLSDEDQETITEAVSSFDDVTAEIWVRQGDSNFRRATIPEATWIDRIGATPDGEIFVHGWGSLGASSWSSTDGVDWEELPRPSHQYINERWGDALIAPSSSGGISILMSLDGEEWEDIGPAENLPGLIQWWTAALAAGPGGIAMSIEGWDDSQQPFPTPMGSQPVRIANGDGTLTIDHQSSRYTLETIDRTYIWSFTTQDGIEVDFETPSLRFLDPESGDPITSFPLEDIVDAQGDVLTMEREAVTNRYGVFAFTSDGEDWTIQSMEDLGPDDFIHLLALTDEHVVATGVDSAGYFHPSSPPGFEVWVAAVP
ncbi:MAG TPA: hypothetical protein VF148_03535 [Acidimicrobiia bacterium]